MVNVNAETFVDVLLEVAAKDPIDNADLRFGEHKLRRLAKLVSRQSVHKPVRRTNERIKV